MWFWTNKDCKSTVRLVGKISIITGSNTSLGRATAVDFYKRGCFVIMACRNLEKAEKARKEIMEELKDETGLGELVVRQLDVSSFKSIREFTTKILDETERIDILVNNAGYGGSRQVTEDGIELTMATNYYGLFLLTILLLPRMLKTGNARIVNVSSLLYAVGRFRFDDPTMIEKNYLSLSRYCSSKLAVNLFTTELSKRLQGKCVNVYALHPGVIESGFFSRLKAYNRWLSKVAFHIFWATPERGSQTQIHCAVDEKAAEESGLFYVNCKPTYHFPNGKSSSSASKLWSISWNLVNLGNFNAFLPEP